MERNWEDTTGELCDYDLKNNFSSQYSYCNPVVEKAFEYIELVCQFSCIDLIKELKENEDSI